MRKHKKVAASQFIRRTEQTNRTRIAKRSYMKTKDTFCLFYILIFYLNLRKWRKVSMTAPCFRPVIPGPGPGQVLTAAHKSDLSPAPATNDEPRFCRKCNVSHLSSALDALPWCQFYLGYYRSKARTHIDEAITLSMTHFNAPITPVHNV